MSQNIGGNGRKIVDMDVDNGNGSKSQKRARTGTPQQQAIAAANVAQRTGPFKDWPGFGGPRTGFGPMPTAMTTTGFRFLSHSAGVMSTQQQPLIAAPSLHSLQPVKKQQVMLPDSRGILRPHHICVETVRHINDIVEAEEKRDNVTQQPSGSMMPFPTISTTSLGSSASTSSVYSSAASLTSQGSLVSHGSDGDFTTTLRQLNQMLAQAKSPDDIKEIQHQIQMIIQKMETQAVWKKHFPEEEFVSAEKNDNGEKNCRLQRQVTSQQCIQVNSETSSAKCMNGKVVQKPKTRFLSRFNLAISRIFAAKL